MLGIWTRDLIRHIVTTWLPSRPISNHSSVDASAPTILRPKFDSQARDQPFFNLNKQKKRWLTII